VIARASGMNEGGLRAALFAARAVIGVTALREALCLVEMMAEFQHIPRRLE
jgi:hypothetical protein